jgi:hypothetical protein
MMAINSNYYFRLVDNLLEQIDYSIGAKGSGSQSLKISNILRLWLIQEVDNHISLCPKRLIKG